MIGCTPPLEEVLEYRGPERYVAVSVTLIADVETPISVFLKLAGDRPNSFLFESVEGGELTGRYSFVGCDVRERLEFSDGRGRVITPDGEQQLEFDDPLEVIRRRLSRWTVWAPQELPRFHGGAVGYIGFDCVRYFEPIPLPERRVLEVPEGILLFADELYVYDHVRRQLVLVAFAPLDGDRKTAWNEARSRLERAVQRLAETALPPSRPWPVGLTSGELQLDVSVNRSHEDMEGAVQRARDAIEAGEALQIVVSQRLDVAAQVDPLVLYRALRALNPSPYMFLLRFERFSVVGASPEVLVRLEDDEILLRPIAGTRRRGADEAEDLALERELLADEKELAEHRMLVDLGRNDVGRVSTIGSVRVERPLHIERYSHVMHIVTDVRGQLAPGLDCFDVLRACFPAGTVSGAPKVRACQLLAELEPERRGPYAGAVGYFGVNGSMDTSIAIRTMVVEPDVVHLQAGAGVVFDSVPANERRECLAKAEAGLRAVELALRGAS